VDVFFDNGMNPVLGDMYGITDRVPVGGEILDLALSRAKPHARFVICGGMAWSRPRVLLDNTDTS
jgi:hypothetical protein